MMKKLLVTLLSASMIAGMIGCAGNTATAPAAAQPAEQTADAPAEDSTEEASEAETEEDAAEAEAAPAAEGEPVTLRMAWWGSQTRHDRTIAVIELYEKLHPNVDIEYEPMDFDGYFNKLATLVASN